MKTCGNNLPGKLVTHYICSGIFVLSELENFAAMVFNFRPIQIEVSIVVERPCSYLEWTNFSACVRVFVCVCVWVAVGSGRGTACGRQWQWQFEIYAQVAVQLTNKHINQFIGHLGG